MLQAFSDVVPEQYPFVHAAYGGHHHFSMEKPPFSLKKVSNREIRLAPCSFA